MSVTSHLKDLLIKMGGTPKNGDSTSVLIDKIEDVYDGSGSGGGSSVGSGILVANATWLLASNDPMREKFEELVHLQYGEDATYHGHFVLDKTWNEVKNAQSAIIKIQSNETDVIMDGSRLFSIHPSSFTFQINIALYAEETNMYAALCCPFLEDDILRSVFPRHETSQIEDVFMRWRADNENDYLYGGPVA